jgi:hypothetical protein
LADFISDFRKRWPNETLLDEGQQKNLAYFSVGDSSFAIELRYRPVPQGVTDEALPSAIRHWRSAKKDLASNLAHLAIATSLVDGKGLDSACALTRVVVALLSVTDSIGACWLNGPVLHTAESFVGIATQMFAAGVPPLILWIGVYWAEEEGTLHTKGMRQFEAPEIVIAQQAQPSPELVAYLFNVAHYVLISERPILDGETMDGPKGVCRIETIRGGNYPDRRALLLIPVRPS